MAPKKDAPQLLTRFRAEHGGIALRAAAKVIGVSHVTLRAWESGAAVPHPDMREAIARWTHGFVPADRWPLTEVEQKLVAAAARVEPFEPPADESGAHAAVDADRTG